jgi:hypothetical protein
MLQNWPVGQLALLRPPQLGAAPPSTPAQAPLLATETPALAAAHALE